MNVHKRNKYFFTEILYDEKLSSLDDNGDHKYIKGVKRIGNIFNKYYNYFFLSFTEKNRKIVFFHTFKMPLINNIFF